MDYIQAIILGILQGLTEFLPVSSSGHLEIGKALLGTEFKEDLLFTVVLHGATVLSTIVVFASEIFKLIKDSLNLKMNDSKIYVGKILLSMLPVLILGIFFEDDVEAFFDGNIRFVGFMLLITAFLLSLTYFHKKDGKKSIGFFDAFIIGLAQAGAVLPGISRSGATISTGLLLGNKREEVTRFSFLMVLIPIIGANILALKDFSGLSGPSDISFMVLFTGFLVAFVSGFLACKWMLSIVKKGKLLYFAAYCLVLGLTAIFFL